MLLGSSSSTILFKLISAVTKAAITKTMSHSTIAGTAQKPVYLIVATAVAPALGIGNNGNLPWSQIRTDMAFFRKVTSDAGSDSKAITSPKESSMRRRNAVIMGRKTWESIPERFRPLGGRLNVILTRGNTAACQRLARRVKDELEKKAEGKLTPATAASATTEVQNESWSLETHRIRGSSTIEHTEKQEQANEEEDVLVHVCQQNNSHSFDEVIVTNSLPGATNLGSFTTQSSNNGNDGQSQINEIFCIGGAEIYGMVLKDDDLRKRVRILQTLVKKLGGDSFECDTFWPETLKDGINGWRQASDDEVRGWIGTDLPQDAAGVEEGCWVTDEKAGVELKVVGWTRT